MRCSARRCAPLFILAFALLTCPLAFRLSSINASDTPIQNAVQPLQVDGTINGDITLFPDLCPSHILFVSVRAPERSFQFRLNDLGTVSVNGTQADSEIFSTLLEQITDLPVDPAKAFPADGTQLLLTLEVHTDQQRHTAYFYGDASSGLAAQIICGTPDAPEYRLTEGWRVGALMMTCEGTRIQDAHGNETPVSLSI